MITQPNPSSNKAIMVVSYKKLKLDFAHLKFSIAQALKNNPQCNIFQIYQENDYIKNQINSLIFSRSNDGITVLFLAIEEDDLNITNLFIEKGADINALTSTGSSLLHFVARTNNIEIADLLVIRGLNVSAKNMNGETALHIAALEGSLEMIEFLVTRCADVNARTRDGYTPLHFAAEKGYYKIAETLLIAGANIDAYAIGGITPRHFALYNCHVEILNLFDSWKKRIDTKKNTNLDLQTSILEELGISNLELAPDQTSSSNRLSSAVTNSNVILPARFTPSAQRLQTNHLRSRL